MTSFDGEVILTPGVASGEDLLAKPVDSIRLPPVGRWDDHKAVSDNQTLLSRDERPALSVSGLVTGVSEPYLDIDT